MRPFTTALAAPAQPDKREHTDGHCYCGMRHTPLEAAQFNQVQHLWQPRPDVIIRGERSKLTRQQDASGWLHAHQAQPEATDVVSLLGAQHWQLDAVADDRAPVVCACGCGEPLKPGKPGKLTNGGKHRVAASRRRKREAAAALS